MKRFVLAAFAAALLIPGAGARNARAQEEGPGAQERSGPPPRMGDKMKEKLGLDEGQSAKFKDAMKAHDEAMKPLGARMKELHEKLHKQVEEKASDADLKATLDALTAQRKAMTAEQEKFHSALAAFLTPTQQAKFVLGAARRMRRMDGERRGPPREKKDRDGDGGNDD